MKKPHLKFRTNFPFIFSQEWEKSLVFFFYALWVDFNFELGRREGGRNVILVPLSFK